MCERPRRREGLRERARSRARVGSPLPRRRTWNCCPSTIPGGTCTWNCPAMATTRRGVLPLMATRRRRGKPELTPTGARFEAATDARRGATEHGGRSEGGKRGAGGALGSGLGTSGAQGRERGEGGLSRCTEGCKVCSGQRRAACKRDSVEVGAASWDLGAMGEGARERGVRNDDERGARPPRSRLER